MTYSAANRYPLRYHLNLVVHSPQPPTTKSFRFKKNISHHFAMPRKMICGPLRSIGKWSEKSFESFHWHSWYIQAWRLIHWIILVRDFSFFCFCLLIRNKFCEKEILGNTSKLKLNILSIILFCQK